jgi:hypothetical protein
MRLARPLTRTCKESVNSRFWSRDSCSEIAGSSIDGPTMARQMAGNGNLAYQGRACLTIARHSGIDAPVPIR